MDSSKGAVCHHCDKECETTTDNYCGKVSLCCGVGYSYEDAKGNIIDENDGLRYLPEWNE